MDRRQALKLLSLFAGGSIAVPAYAEKILHYPDHCWQHPPEGFPPAQTALLAALADCILPPTDSPGAAEAGVQHVVPVLADDCLSPAERDIFYRGLERIDLLSQEQYHNTFALLEPSRQNALLVALEQEYIDRREQPDAPPHFFKLAKDLILIGYFTSETGATQALRYLPVPGRWEADLPYTPGQKAWAL